HAAWRARFGGDPQVVGQTLMLMEFGTTATIVGVMPAGLEFPKGTELWAAYVPARLKSDNDTTAYTAMDLLARVAPGATAANATAELTAYYNRLDANQWSRDVHGDAMPFQEVVLGNARRAVLIFLGAAALLLLITCIDVANLLLVRGLSRVREIAVRGALGASRSQLVAQLALENALLAAAGAALGIMLAMAGIQAFRAFAPGNTPLLETVRLDRGMLAGAILSTSIAALLFGLAPAFVTARADVQGVLRSGTRQSASRRSRL